MLFPSTSLSRRVGLGWGQCLDRAARFLGAPHERCATRLIGEPRATPQLHRRPSFVVLCSRRKRIRGLPKAQERKDLRGRSEEHTSELQSLMRISYAVFCLKKKNKYNTIKNAHLAVN